MFKYKVVVLLFIIIMCTSCSMKDVMNEGESTADESVVASTEYASEEITKEMLTETTEQSDVPSFLLDIADNVRTGDGMGLWRKAQLEYIATNYTDYQPCVLVIDGKWYKSLYREDGLVIMECRDENGNPKACRLVYGDKEISVPIRQKLLDGTWVFGMDIDKDGNDELVVQSYGSFGESDLLNIICMDTFELMKINTSLNFVLAEYSINVIEEVSETKKNCQFYLKDYSGAEYFGDISISSSTAYADNVEYEFRIDEQPLRIDISRTEDEWAVISICHIIDSCVEKVDKNVVILEDGVEKGIHIEEIYLKYELYYDEELGEFRPIYPITISTGVY